MAAIMPNTPGTGNNIPISSYVAGITESYPNVNRQRMVESSISSKETIDFLPTNIGINQSSLSVSSLIFLFAFSSSVLRVSTSVL